MAASPGAEESVYQAAKSGLRRFLGRAREVVMAPWNRFKSAPDANAIYAAIPIWQADVDRIVAALTPVLQEGWAAAHLSGQFQITDPYVQANLALTRNLLVRIPDEVHALVVRQVLEGVNRGDVNDLIAARVDAVLDYTGSENWDHRARVIAQTEANRHYNSSLLAHALLVEREDGGIYLKEWQTLTDGRERTEHLEADHQVQVLNQPFIVGDEPLMFPCDPNGRPHNVIKCRCGMTIRRA